MAFTLDDLLSLEPSKVSRELNGYITYIYGQPKVGKTTLAKDMKALILACEDGTRAMTGAYDVIIKTWNDIKQIARYAKDEKMKSKYKAIAVDTVDIASQLCEKYICNQQDVESLAKIQWGGGWSLFKKEFEEVFRGLSLEGYAILFISHDKTKEIEKANGTKYTKIVPTVSDTINNIVMNMSDIIGYAYQEDDSEDRYLILRGGNDITAGTRFPYMKPRIPFSYTDLVNALNEAIDEEEKHSGSEAIGERKAAIFEETTYDFEGLNEEFKQIVGALLQKDQAFYPPRITQTVEKYLGKGKKVAEATIDQAELLFYINKELKEEYLNK